MGFYFCKEHMWRNAIYFLLSASGLRGPKPFCFHEQSPPGPCLLWAQCCLSACVRVSVSNRGSLSGDIGWRAADREVKHGASMVLNAGCMQAPERLSILSVFVVLAWKRRSLKESWISPESALGCASAMSSVGWALAGAAAGCVRLSPR